MNCLLRPSLRARGAVMSHIIKLGCPIVLALCPSLAAAASYSSAAATFNWIDASTHIKLGPSTGGVYSPSYQFTNPGTCGTALPVIDDAITDNIPIGFTFVYGGASFTQARVMSNGRLQFNDNAWCGYGSPVTQQAYPDGNVSYTMRIYGADLDPSLQAEVGGSYSTPCVSRDSCFVSYATLGTAPNRRFVVTWSNVPEWANFGEAVGNYNLQIILQENGDFIYQYGPHAPGPGSVPAQIGWELGGADYAETAVGYPAENSAIQFSSNMLVSNGGFEAGAGGNGTYTYQPTDQGFWVFGPGAGITGANSGFTSANSPPTEGRLAAFLQNQGTIAQTGGVAVAGNYMLTFRLVNRANYGCQQSLAVRVDGTTVLALPVPVQPIATEWMHVATPPFALTAGGHTVQLAGTQSGGDCTAFVDDVKLEAAPTFSPTQILGSFEEWQIGAQNYHYSAGAQPWAFTVGSGLIANGSAFGSPNAPQGAQAAFVQDTGYMTQTWTDAGDSYQLQFSAAGRLSSGTPTLTASIDGTTIGSWTLGNSAYAAFSAPVTLAPGPHTVRFASSGGDSFVDDVQLVAAGATATPGGFNAFESGTAAGAIAGVIHTKVAGAPFTIDVVALNAARTAVLTAFTGSVKVELLDGADNSGALDAGGCRASWPTLPGNAPATLAFAAADSGRKSVTLSEANAWRDLRVRVSTPVTGAPTTVACSGDNFANRPASFAAFAATDADSASAGTARSLANAAATGGGVHQAGRPFTVRAAAVNAVGATTTNYVGTATPLVAACAGTACIGTAGTLTLAATAVAGVIDRSASYDEVGSIALQLVDSAFAAVDAADGSSAAERTIASPAIVVGRFVPDHLDLVVLAAPTLRTFGSSACAARSFTYVGQPFGYAAVPQATVYARNAAGATTANYSGVLWKLGPATQAWSALPATPALDATAATLPAITSNNNGSGLAAAQAADRLRFARPANAPVAPFDAQIALTWTVRDTSETAVAGNAAIASAPLVFANMAFDAGTQFRYGVLRLVPAYGSELIDLPVLVEAQYWDGIRMATHSADQCTPLAPASVALGNWQRNLSACKTAVATTAATLASGRGFLRLARPGNGNGGSVDLGVQLGASATGQTCTTVGAASTPAVAANLPWLQGKWSGAAAFDQNPATRASFGQYRSPFIYQRESY